MGRLDGRSAIVTGGTRGIGFAIAKRLVADGATVIATGRSVGGTVPEGARYAAVTLDDSASLEAFAARVAEFSPDILVNNAGINKLALFTEIAMTDFARIQQVNVAAVFRLCQAAVPGMRRRKWGRVVSITSIWGKISRAGRASYSTSKFAIDGMTAALAAEVASDGVLVNCVAPGIIDSDMTRQVLGAQGIAELAAQIPLGRLGRPEEIAAFVAWLVSPENSYISGQNLAIDGGFTRV
jgi:NAD(P)-dependent dehydrogenase (short-subunit alcohol dehydrogenase family)